jgi:hypothetical protein
MTPTTLFPTEPPITLPDPDAIRAAIDATDERARLLRRLLRLALRLRPYLATASRPVPTK